MSMTLSQPAPACADAKPGLNLEVAARRRRMAARLAGLRSAEGLVPVCGWCRRVRDSAGAWVPVERDLLEGAGAALTHGVCPDCAHRLLEHRRDAA